MGAAPRYFGSNEACRLRFPRDGRSIIHCGMMRPYPTTMIASGLIPVNCSRNSTLVLILSGWLTSSPNSSASCFTGDEASSMPRPFGLSGCVTTSRIAKPASTSFSRVGTANAGVPQKTRLREEGIGLRTRTSDLRPQPRSGFETPAGARGPRSDARFPLPLAGLHQLADLAFHEIALQSADVADVQLAVQMIGLVQEGASQQIFAGLLEPLSIHVLRPDHHLAGTRHRLPKLGNAEAAFVLGVAAFGANDFRIGDHQPGVRVLLEGDVDDRQPLRNSNLRRRQSHAVRSVHGLEHVLDQFLERAVKNRNRFSKFFQYGISKLHDGIDHASSVVCRLFISRQ